MLLTIHNLPANTRYADIKSLLHSQCGLQYVILDNLIGEGGGKKVTVGVAEEADAAVLMRKINGLYWNGQQLYVKDVRHQKKASEQPFGSDNSQQQDSNSSFFSMNLQQHSSYNNMLTPVIKPLMTTNYYVPDHQNQGYEQSGGYGQSGKYQQGQNFDQVTQKVQSAFMRLGGYSQTATQMIQVGTLPQNKNQNFSHSQNQNSGWRDNCEQQDFPAERPVLGRRSPEINRAANWIPNVPLRDRSREGRAQPWAQGFNNCADRPTQPDFEPNFRADDRSGFQNYSRPDFSQNDRSGFAERNPDFRPNDRSDFDERRPDLRSNDRTGFERHSDFRPDDRSGFKKQKPDFRPNERSGFKERWSNFGSVNQERRGQFSGRPNKQQGRTNEPDEFSERPRAVRRSNERHEPHEFSGRLNRRQRRQMEFGDRKGPLNPGSSKQNARSEFNRSYEHEFRRSDGCSEFPSRNPSERYVKPDRKHPRPDFPDTRKRKFEQRFEKTEIDRPERLSRPKDVRQRPAKIAKYQANVPFLSEDDKAKRSKKMLIGGLRRIMSDICENVGKKPNLATRQALRKLVSSRMICILAGRTMVTSLECHDLYRAVYPAAGDKEAYDTAFATGAKQKANKEANGIESEVAVKHEDAEPVTSLPRSTKNQKKAKRDQLKKIKEAKQLVLQGKVPSYPQGDKKLVAQHKAEEKKGFIPEVEPMYKEAMEEEIKRISDLFIHELNNAPSTKQQQIYDMVEKDTLVLEFTKNLTQHLSRRITDTGLKVVRIYGQPKLPKREILSKIVLRYGALSLRKSGRSPLYTTAVDTYENYDKLCALEPVTVEDGNTINFKPFHLAQKPKVDQKLLRIMRRKFIEEMIDKSQINLLDKDWPEQEAEYKKKQAELAAEEAKRSEAQKANEEDGNTENDVKDVKLLDINDETSKEAVNNPLDSDFHVKDEVNETSKDAANNYIDDKFHVIDEVNETDSDVEYTGCGNEIIKIDEDINDADNVENDEGNNVDNNDGDGVENANNDEIGVEKDNKENGVENANNDEIGVENDKENGVENANNDEIGVENDKENGVENANNDEIGVENDNKKNAVENDNKDEIGVENDKKNSVESDNKDENGVVLPNKVLEDGQDVDIDDFNDDDLEDY